MTHDYLILAGGLVLLVVGGDMLVRGSASLAARFGVSPLIVGLTVVAFGTSAPELSVNVSAALRGSGELSFGNIVGSNVANIALVIGLTALVRPVGMPLGVITREIPMMTLASLVALAMALDVGLGDGAQRDAFSQSDGVILLLLFCVFLYYTIGDALRQRGARAAQADSAAPGTPLIVSLGLTVLGLGALVYGGKVTVDAATALARGLGISEAVIGMTIVAVGTSLPELVTSIMSVARGHTDLAVGNAVGSNIFNLLFVLGVTSVIRPVPVPASGHGDLIFVAALSAILLPLSFGPGRRISRLGGALLFGGYVAYLWYRSS